MPQSEPTDPETPRKVVPLDERRLLPAYRRGDAHAFVELVQRYHAPVYGYLVRCGVPTSARDDLFQEIFIRVHGAASTYQPERPVKPWIFTIVANAVRTYYRKERVERLVFGPTDPPADDDADPVADAEAQETAKWLSQAIATLPLAQREAVILVCIEGLELAQAASVLDLPVGTMKTNLHRARLALTRALAQRRARAQREANR
jgi:RNA polymerase sigma-70 factor (ECF subfamily)